MKIKRSTHFYVSVSRMAYEHIVHQAKHRGMSIASYVDERINLALKQMGSHGKATHGTLCAECRAKHRRSA